MARVVQLLQADPVVDAFTSKLGKNHEGLNGVAVSIGSLTADLAKEPTEAKAEEEHSQQDTEASRSQSALSRADQVTEVVEMENTKASISASLTKSTEELASAVTRTAETTKVLTSLHQSCD